MFLQTMAPPTLDEFVDLCLLFGLRPSTALDKAMQEAAESVSPAGERRPVLSVSPADTVPPADDDAPLSTQEIMAMAANKDHNRDLEAETPRD